MLYTKTPLIVRVRWVALVGCILRLDMKGTQLLSEGARKGDRSREDKESLEFGDVIVT